MSLCVCVCVCVTQLSYKRITGGNSPLFTQDFSLKKKKRKEERTNKKGFIEIIFPKSFMVSIVSEAQLRTTVKLRSFIQLNKTQQVFVLEILYGVFGLDDFSWRSLVGSEGKFVRPSLIVVRNKRWLKMK